MTSQPTMDLRVGNKVCSLAGTASHTVSTGFFEKSELGAIFTLVLNIILLYVSDGK